MKNPLGFLMRRLCFVALALSVQSFAAEGGKSSESDAPPLMQSLYNEALSNKSTNLKDSLRKIPTSQSEFNMKCSRSDLTAKASKISIKFESFRENQNKSFVAIDEKGKFLVLAATPHRGYYLKHLLDDVYGSKIDDNDFEIADIRSNLMLSLRPELTYGHLDKTGYPYPVFVNHGYYLIAVLDDVIYFDRGGLKSLRNSAPKILAGCVFELR